MIKQLVSGVSKYSPQEEVTYGKILQMLYLAEWRNINIDLSQFTGDNVNRTYGEIQRLLVGHYMNILAGQRSEENRFVFGDDYSDGFTTQRLGLAEECDPELYESEAKINLELDLRLLPTVPCHEHPFDKINRFHEK